MPLDRVEAHLARLRAADQAISTRERKAYVGAREVELRDQAVEVLRRACSAAAQGHGNALLEALADGNEIVTEIDDLHSLAVLDACRGAGA